MAINQLIAHHFSLFSHRRTTDHVCIHFSLAMRQVYGMIDQNKIFSDTIDFHHEIATLNLTIPEDNFIRGKQTPNSSWLINS